MRIVRIWAMWSIVVAVLLSPVFAFLMAIAVEILIGSLTDAGLPVLPPLAIAGALAWLLRLPRRVEVELDDIGTYVIGRMDGRTMQALADDLAGYLKLTRREAEAALTLFIQSLLRRRLIVLGGLAGSSA